MIEEVDSSDKSIEINSGLIRAERKSKQRKQSSNGDFVKKQSNQPGSMIDKLKKGTIYMDSSSDEDY